MPSWGIHLAVANKVLDKLNNKLNEKEKNEFIFANVLPDINNGYVIKDINKNISHKQTHFELKEFMGDYGDKPGYINFYEKYKNDILNPTILGYYTHLMADYYFNTVTYNEYGIYDENNNRIGAKLNNGQNLILTESDEFRRIKSNDFKIFSFYLYNNENINIPEYSEEIEEKTKKIEDISITKNDIYNTVEYLKQCTEKPQKIIETAINKDYKIYTEDELKRRVDLCVDFVIENIYK